MRHRLVTVLIVLCVLGGTLIYYAGPRFKNMSKPVAVVAKVKEKVKDKMDKEMRKLEKEPKVGRTQIIRMKPTQERGNTRIVKCGVYQCLIEVGGPSKDADMIVFTSRIMDSLRSPPPKPVNVLWTFEATEPQWMKMKNPSQWDGMFNYSLTYLSGTEGANYNFADKIHHRKRKLTRNFARLRRQRRVNALWFVSHCTQPHRPVVSSARGAYAKELAKYIDIDAFTSHKSCREHLGSMVKDKKGGEPRMSSYSFYLSFENSLCRDYISEKLWKVLEADVFTIPVVLGGLSIDEYERVAPPNSFIHVKNFTSPKALADHLHYVVNNDHAYNYYLQWRNEYRLTGKGMYAGSDCYFCRLAHERPKRIWKTFSKDFGSHNCLDVTSQLCPYYNISC